MEPLKMFGENKSVQISKQLGKKLMSALLVYSFVLLSFASSVNAQSIKFGKVTLRPTAKQKFISDVKMDDFQAEAFAGAVKISWKTGFERNILGFKVWRD